MTRTASPPDQITPERVPPGLLIAAPGSGSGKTTVTLALLRHFRKTGRIVAPVKVGPDYIDPAFHAAAGGRPCTNLDSWAMREATLTELARRAGQGCDFVLGEGVMGLFDGAPGCRDWCGRGSTADLARITGWPVVLVVDARGMAASAAAVVHGFASLDPRIALAGVIFNRVGSERHAEALRRACEPLGIPVLGFVPAAASLELPSRHLGLVQAGEHAGLEAFVERAACEVAGRIDADRLADLARSRDRAAPDRGAAAVGEPLLGRPPMGLPPLGLPPFGQRIAVARDTAFAFSYPFLLQAWRDAGAEIVFFSPLDDQAPDARADAVYLPGGYPELYAGRLAANRNFMGGLGNAAGRGAAVYGECGGYMVLGRALTDAEGIRHPMAGLLPQETAFAPSGTGAAQRRMTLGYREADLLAAGPLGPAGTSFRGHEFHYAREVPSRGTADPAPAEGDFTRLFRLRDARGEDLGESGWRGGRVSGSFLHIVDASP